MNRYGWNDGDIKSHFKKIVARGWLSYFLRAAVGREVEPTDLMAIASRETNVQEYFTKHTGDNGNGHGLMQVDKRYHPAHIESGDWLDVSKNIDYGANILDSNIRVARERNVPEHALREVAIAGYNGSLAKVINLCHAGELIDNATTHKNYSSDVIARALIMKAELEKYNAEKS